MEKNMVKFYTIGCALCNVLKTKMDAKNIEYETISAREEDGFDLSTLPVKSMPALEIDGKWYNQKEAMNWVKEQ